MLRLISPTIKGLLTGIVMVAIALLVYYTNQPIDSPLHYLIYAVYAVGIVWTLLSHTKSVVYKGTFGDLFSQGFRCFIVVTLIMVLFYWLFSKTHPRLVEEGGEMLRKQLIQEKKLLPDNIDKEVSAFKSQYGISLVSRAIFGYLIVGTIVTAISSGIITSMKNK